jgi:hypothetical protein
MSSAPAKTSRGRFGLASVAHIVSIDAIRLEALREGEGVASKFEMNAAIGSSLEGTALVYQVTFTVVASNNGVPIANVGCAYAVRFLLPDDYQATPEEVLRFGAQTAQYAAVPYAREWVQSAFARLGLGQVTMPLFRIPIEATIPGTGKAKSKSTKPH